MLAVLSSTARVRCARTCTGSSRVSHSPHHPGLPSCLKNNRAQRTRTMHAAVGSDGPRALFSDLPFGASGELWKSAVLSRLEKFIAETPSGRVRRVAVRVSPIGASDGLWKSAVPSRLEKFIAETSSGRVRGVAVCVLSLGYGATPHVDVTPRHWPCAMGHPSQTAPQACKTPAAGTLDGACRRSRTAQCSSACDYASTSQDYPRAGRQTPEGHTLYVLTCRVRCVARHANHPGEVARSWMSSLAKPDEWLSAPVPVPVPAPVFAGPWQEGNCVY